LRRTLILFIHYSTHNHQNKLHDNRTNANSGCTNQPARENYFLENLLGIAIPLEWAWRSLTYWKNSLSEKTVIIQLQWGWHKQNN
jgi:hypothetical protein